MLKYYIFPVEYLTWFLFVKINLKVTFYCNYICIMYTRLLFIIRILIKTTSEKSLLDYFMTKKL